VVADVPNGLDQVTLIEYTLVAVRGRLEESVTFTVNWYVPAVVGAPEMVPSGPSDRPGGRLPEATAQVYGAVPPTAPSVA
jgi:hypothetical protein